jgi:hypothetical protein
VKKALVVNGREDEQGRALFVVSALYHCLDALRGRVVRFIDVDCVAVEMAVGVLAFDGNVQTEIVPRGAERSALQEAALYVAVAFDDDAQALALLDSDCAPPRLVALQFPPYERMTPENLSVLAAAHSHRIFAALVADRLS